jgi:ribosomal protein S6--L-glutamate ligase
VTLIVKKTLIGWEEWFSLPQLGIPAIKAKIDTGAKTSALHALNINSFTENHHTYVSFEIYPLKTRKIKMLCKAPLIDRRFVTDSGGKKELRYVIHTSLGVNGKYHNIEVTLTDRHYMNFRMLLGREAMRKAGLVVDPSVCYELGKMGKKQVLDMYNAKY